MTLKVPIYNSSVLRGGLFNSNECVMARYTAVPYIQFV